MSLPLDPFVFEPAQLAECAREMIHLPGRIQANGALLATDGAASVIGFASENAPTLLGRSREDLFRQPLAQLVGEAGREAIIRAADTPHDGVPVPVPGIAATLAVPAHTVFAHRRDNRLLIELVREETTLIARLPIAATLTEMSAAAQRSHAGEHGIGAHALRERTGDPVMRASSTYATLANSPAVVALTDHVARRIREMTGYDRVMVYKFHVDDHGEVIAEAKRDGLDTYVGLHYPAADIPPQARALYLQTPVRVLHGVHRPTIPVIAADEEVAARSLDLGGALLRAFSPVHLQYLHNMGVEATLVVSIVVEDRLWGLVACHHHEPYWPDFAQRFGSQVIVGFLAAELRALEAAAVVDARTRTHATQHAIVQAMQGSDGGYAALPAVLRTLLPNDGVAIVTADECHVAGRAPPLEQLRALDAWLRRERPGESVAAIDSLSRTAPALDIAAETACGVLSVVVRPSEPARLLWFRGEYRRVVRWAGQPDQAAAATDGTGNLAPRGSFAAWEHEARGMCDPWTLEDIAVAESVRGVVVGVLLELVTMRHRMARLELLRIRRAVESSSAPLGVLDERGRVVYANPAMQALLGRSAAELATPGLLTSLLGGLEGGASEWCELQLTRGDGIEIPVEVRRDVITDAEGSVGGTLVAVRDLRQARALDEARRLVEQKLLHTQKLESLGVMAGGIAHDFNNLLTAIMANASLAEVDLAPISPAHECLREITVASRSAAELCRQLLAYAGRGRFVVEPLDLNALVRLMGTLLRTAIGARASTRLELAESLPPIRGDSAQLQQVIMNLIVNASDAIGERAGDITITTSLRSMDRPALQRFLAADELPEGEYIALSVRDTGHGMDAATQHRVFDPFFSTKFTGRGLGLAAVQGIVRGHGGAIRLESTVGVGTTFEIVFPVDQRRSVAAAPATEPTSVHGDGRLVVVIDDDPHVRQTAHRLLTAVGFEVQVAEHGRAGLELLTSLQAAGRQPVLVLLDLTMPTLSGGETLATLRGERRLTCPVILMSGYAEDDASALLRDHASVSFVQKPFTTVTLYPALARALNE